MANGNPTKGTTSSFQVSRSSIWRDGSGVFSWNSFEEDDEEALKWAALEILPTYNHLKKGLLITSNGEVKEIDVTLKEKFVWAAQPIYKHEEVLEEQWKCTIQLDYYL
ncbi:hypothetical protein DEO72_LG2g3118 [Vigna unguiculata]|uniref:Uncharacterized protein n=1 Tax=Vigna unguiculata TaxID=3917 RepID=A0A4D6L2L8_VIGUN|nr:hypothetical protein DEO72_LG2g3118 [Vigna unguiculata]